MISYLLVALLAMLGGACMLAIGVGAYFMWTSISKLAKSVDTINSSLSRMLGDQALFRQLQVTMENVAAIAAILPQTMEGMLRLSKAVSIFNTVISDKDAELHPEGDLSGFYPYNERQAAVSEASAEAVRRKMKVSPEQVEQAIESEAQSVSGQL